MRRDRVKDCFWISVGSSNLRSLSAYSYDDRLKEYADRGELERIYELGCVKEDMEKERPYLLEGDIDYERMVAEGGVLLCDISPSDESGKRKTDYKAGDIIETVSFEGEFKAKDAYSAAVAAVSERHGMDAWQEINDQIIFFENGEKKSRKRENKKQSDKAVKATVKPKKGSLKNVQKVKSDEKRRNKARSKQ
jgi:hypothetical protein